MKIVITGATSFVGRSLTRKLNLCGHKCVPVIRPGRHDLFAVGEFLQVIELEMSEYGNLHEQTGDVDCLINLAWLGTRGDDRMDSKMQMESYQNTMNAIRSYQDGGCKCIFTAGSQAEYGAIDGYIKESDSLHPNTEYGKYKSELFYEASEFCKKNGIRLIEPRFFSLYGPGDYDKTMVVNILKKMRMNETCDLTMGIQNWDFLYIDDAVDGIVALMENETEEGAYNFASGDVRPLKKYIEEMKMITGSKSQLNFGAVPYPKTGMVSIMADISKLKRNTGWHAKTSFRAGIKAVLETI